MKDFFVKIKNLSIITIIASLIIGVILLIRPEETLRYISLFCGATLIALGAAAWISYFSKTKSTLQAILGTVSAVAGIVICIKYESIISAIIFLFGLFILISGIVDLFTAIDARKFRFSSWIVSLILSAATVILGLLVVFNPFDSMLGLTRLLGVGLILYAVMDLIALVQIRKTVKEAARIINDNGEIEAFAEESDD